MRGRWRHLWATRSVKSHRRRMSSKELGRDLRDYLKQSSRNNDGSSASLLPQKLGQWLNTTKSSLVDDQQQCQDDAGWFSDAQSDPYLPKLVLIKHLSDNCVIRSEMLCWLLFMLMHFINIILHYLGWVLRCARKTWHTLSATLASTGHAKYI